MAERDRIAMIEHHVPTVSWRRHGPEASTSARALFARSQETAIAWDVFTNDFRVGALAKFQIVRNRRCAWCTPTRRNLEAEDAILE